MAGQLNPVGVVDAILASEELRNGLFRAVSSSERSVQQRRRNETVEEEVSAVFRGNSTGTPVSTVSSVSNTPVSNTPLLTSANRFNFGETSRSQSYPIFQMRRNYSSQAPKR
jgi:chorismate synthase